MQSHAILEFIYVFLRQKKQSLLAIIHSRTSYIYLKKAKNESLLPFCVFDTGNQRIFAASF